MFLISAFYTHSRSCCHNHYDLISGDINLNKCEFLKNQIPFLQHLHFGKKGKEEGRKGGRERRRKGGREGRGFKIK